MSVRLAKRLVEPDYWTGPHGERTRPESFLTFGPEVADVCATAGFAPDPQQELALDLIFAIRPDGLSAGFEFAVVCCRQNMKTGLFKQVVLGWLYVTDQRLVVWSAHEMSTTREAHRDLADLIKDTPQLRRRLKATPNEGIYDANGEERIELATGQRILFKARTLSGGRGLTGDKVILDEAFALKASHVGSLLPTMMARPDPQVLYGSSAGKLDSDILRDIRDRGRASSSPRLSYLEWCAPVEPCADLDCQHPKFGADGCALDRVDLWEKANPTVTTGRITLETIAGMRQALPPEEFARECLGWWEDPPNAGEQIFAPAGWGSRAIEEGEPPAVRAIGLGVSVDGAWGSMAAAGIWPKPDERLHLGAVDRRRGPTWLVDESKRIQTKTRCLVAIDGRGPAAYLIPALEAAGVKLLIASTDDYLQSCSGLYARVQDGTVTHMSHDDLDDAVRCASWRTVGDRRAFGRRTSSGDISMLEAASLAGQAAVNDTPSKPNIW